MLKTIMLSQMLITNEVLAANEVGSVKRSDTLIEKYRKLLKTRKLSKSWKLAKSGKKLLKSGNLPNFDTNKNKPSFLAFDAKMAFNYLRLTFIKARIFWHFDPKCHIWIETNALRYAISDVLNQLTFKTKPDEVVTKTDLG